MERKIHLDIFRIIASALVIFNHLEGFYLYQQRQGLVQYFFMFISIIVKIAVPLFFMISGAVLLGKEESYTVVIKKRVLRICITLVFFESALVLVEIIKCLIQGAVYNNSARELVWKMVSGTIDGAGAYWFMYAYLGMLICLPLLQKVAKQLSREDVIVLVVIHVLFCSVLPIVNFILSNMNVSEITVSNHLKIPFALENAFFFPILGYYLEKNGFPSKRFERALGVASFAGIIVCMICTKLEGVDSGNYTQNYITLFDYLLATFLFCLGKKKFGNERKNKSHAEFWVSLSKLTFGIYLFDPLFRAIGYDGYKKLVTEMPVLGYSLLWVALSVLLGGGITFCLRKSKIVQKIL